MFKRLIKVVGGWKTVFAVTTYTVPPKIDQAVQRGADLKGLSKAEWLKDAISVYCYLCGKEAAGFDTCIAKDGVIIQTIENNTGDKA